MADNCTLKFCRDIKEHWEKKGHEVRYEVGASEHLAQWADLYYIDWWDNNFHYLFNWYKEHPEAKKPKFAVRAIDWDIWAIDVRSQEMVDFVDHIITIAPHMYEKVKNNTNAADDKPIVWNNKLSLIRPGLDLDKFPLKKYNSEQFNIGMVCGDMWEFKNAIGGYQIFAILAKRNTAFKFHVRGQYVGNGYASVMHEHFVKTRNLNLTLYPPMDNMLDFYNKIDFLIVPSLKEAFSYATAEAMAMGIKPVINNFLGSEGIWPKTYIFNTYKEAVDSIHTYTKEQALDYRNFIIDNYSLTRMLAKYDALLGT